MKAEIRATLCGLKTAAGHGHGYVLRKITENVEKHSNTSMVEQQRGKGGDKHFRTEIGNHILFYIV